MGIEQLTDIEIIEGIFDIMFVLISMFTGVKLVLKYFSHKQISLITIGLAWIFFSLTWSAGALSIILIIFFDILLDKTVFLIMANAFSPIALVCWIYSFCKLLYSQYIKYIVPAYVIICTIYELLLFYLIFTAPELVAVFYGTFFYRPQLFTFIFYVFGVTSILITGILFTIETFKSIDQKLRWKGRFLLLAFISLTISITLNGILTISPVIYFFIKILQISSAFEYYLGFFLPEKIAKFLIKEN